MARASDNLTDPRVLEYEAALAHYRPGMHRLAVLTAAATFPLIFMGGLVTSHQAGMSVPDWPNSYGYNMFLFPPSQWIGGIFYEHTHRLAGTVVGVLSILLACWAWWTHERRQVRWLAAGLLGAVILQGVIGGLRVIWVNLDLAIVHACLAQAFFCLTAVMVAATSRWWSSKGGLTPLFASAQGRTSAPADDARASRRIAVLAAIAVAAIYAQLIVGALMRHFQAGLAIADLPLAYGHLLPPLDAAQLAVANRIRVTQLNLDPVTLGQVWIHFAHRLGAVAVTAAVVYLTMMVRRHRHQIPLLVRPALVLAALLVAQITLGVLTVLWGKPADIASAHVAIGALTLFTAFTLGIRAARQATFRDSASPEPAPYQHRNQDVGRPVIA